MAEKNSQTTKAGKDSTFYKCRACGLDHYPQSSFRHHYSQQCDPKSMAEVRKAIDHLLSVMADAFDLPHPHKRRESDGQSTAKHQPTSDMVRYDRFGEDERNEL